MTCSLLRRMPGESAELAVHDLLAAPRVPGATPMDAGFCVPPVPNASIGDAGSCAVVEVDAGELADLVLHAHLVTEQCVAPIFSSPLTVAGHPPGTHTGDPGVLGQDALTARGSRLSSGTAAMGLVGAAGPASVKASPPALVFAAAAEAPVELCVCNPRPQKLL